MQIDNRTEWNTDDLRKLVDETRRRLSGEKVEAIKYDCPNCGVKPGAACLSEKLHALARPHKERVEWARECSLVGVADAGRTISTPSVLQFSTSRRESYKAIWQLKSTTGRRVVMRENRAMIVLPRWEIISRLVALHFEDLLRYGKSRDRSLRPLGQDLRRFDWAEAFPVRRVEPKPKPKRAEVVDGYLQKLRASEKRWTTKYKLATTKLKGIRKKIKYYEKELAKEKTDG